MTALRFLVVGSRVPVSGLAASGSILGLPLSFALDFRSRRQSQSPRRQSALGIAYVGTDYENEGWLGVRPNNFDPSEDLPDLPFNFHDDDPDRTE